MTAMFQRSSGREAISEGPEPVCFGNMRIVRGGKAFPTSVGFLLRGCVPSDAIHPSHAPGQSQNIRFFKGLMESLLHPSMPRGAKIAHA